MTKRPALPYGRQTIQSADLDAVRACLTDTMLTQGPRVAEFEQALCAATGAKYAVSVTSGTAALHLAALALDVKRDDVGIVPAVTFLASANAIRYANGKVAFCDVERDTGLLDISSLNDMVDRLVAEGRPPKVIIPVDLTGHPADLVRVRAAADRVGAAVLHDAAHSLGGSMLVGGTRLPTGGTGLAEATILSFHPVKHITTAEGGAVLTDNESTYRRVLELRNHGMHKDAERMQRAPSDPWVGPWYYEQDQLGFNYRLPDLLCALGLAQLERLEVFVTRRREIASRYDAGFRAAGLEGWMRPLRRPHAVGHAFHLYVGQLVRRPGESLDSVAARRKALYLALIDDGILTQVHYVPVPWHPAQRDAVLPVEGIPGAEAYYAASLSLPMFPLMDDSDVDRTLEALEKARAKAEL